MINREQVLVEQLKIMEAILKFITVIPLYTLKKYNEEENNNLNMGDIRSLVERYKNKKIKYPHKINFTGEVMFQRYNKNSDGVEEYIKNG